MNSSKRLLHRLMVGAGFILFSGAWLCAQVDTGALQGTVQDQSGAVIPGARVTLTNQGTSFSLVTVTSGSGTYTFTPIKIGTYTVAVEMQGFRKATHTDITVNVQQQVTVDITLIPGQVTQTVEVTAAPPILQSQNASVGQVVGTREINDLPLNGRNYTFLAQLSAGVTQESPTGRGMEATGSFAANGMSTANNDYILDGIDNNNDSVDFLNGASYAVKPPVDAIQEFKIQTSNFSAEFGRAGGAVLNATIKSGTNQIHGDLWEFLRNDKFDAANFFENSPSHVNKGEFRQNQFGGAIGGPITIPHVYNGRDKSFFFFDYEGTRIRQAAPQVASVPTARERASGFTDLSELIADQSGTRSDLLGRTFPLGTVFDPATTRTVTAGSADPVTGLPATASGFVRDPFYTGASITGITDFTTPVQIAFLNHLPAGRLDPNAIKLLQLYPAPTGSGIFNNFTADPVVRNDTKQYDIRIDHNFSERDQMFGRFSYADNPDFVPGPFQGIADGSSFTQDTFHNNSVSAVLSETHSFTPTLINEFRAGYSRLATSQFQPFAHTQGIPAQFGIQGIPQNGTNGGLPKIDPSGLNSLGPAAFVPGERFSETLQLSENLTKIFGSHTFKGGFEYQHLRFPWFAPAWPRGEFDFNGSYTEVPSNGGGSTGLAQLLLGPIPSTVPGGIDNVGGTDAAFASNFTGPDDHRNYYAAYFQDNWKVSPKLTLELGLRWELYGQVVEKYGAQANFIPGPPGAGAEYDITLQRVGSPLSPSFPATLAKDGIKLAYSATPGLTNTPLHDFAPRASLAYRVTPKLVVRTGYGIYYAGFTNIGGSPDIGSNYPFLFNFSFFSPDAGHPLAYPNGGLGTLENGLTAVPLSPVFVNASGLGLEGLQTGYKTPFTQEYNFSLQYELTPNQTLQLGYVGNVSFHGETGPGLNQPSVIIPVTANPQNYVPFPDFGRGGSYIATEGNSHYDSAQLTFERRFSQGLNLLANYTYSKCRTDSYQLLGLESAAGYRAPYLPGFGVQGDYSLCGIDVPNMVHVSGTWQVPLGRGQRWGRGMSGVANQIIGGWAVNWILTLQDGFPFNVGCPVGTTGDFGCTALLVPGANIYAGPHNVNQWLNPAAFNQPCQLGSAGPILGTTPGCAPLTGIGLLGGGNTQAHGPGFHRSDLSLFKSFRTTERTRLEFRAEFFNLTNTPQFGNPSFLDFTNKSNFGLITGLRDGANDPRQIQFALKFYF